MVVRSSAPPQAARLIATRLAGAAAGAAAGARVFPHRCPSCGGSTARPTVRPAARPTPRTRRRSRGCAVSCQRSSRLHRHPSRRRLRVGGRQWNCTHAAARTPSRGSHWPKGRARRRWPPSRHHSAPTRGTHPHSTTPSLHLRTQRTDSRAPFSAARPRFCPPPIAVARALTSAAAAPPTHPSPLAHTSPAYGRVPRDAADVPFLA